MVDVGAVVDRYEIGALLGQGGMGRVFRARDTRLDREVAIKIVAVGATDDADEARRRLLREARAAAALDHPGAVNIFDVGEHEGTPYIVMELIRGETLRAAMRREAHQGADKLRWLLEVARVLRAAHQQNLIHRDIKPENVMLRPDGSIRVLDFGIARRPRKPVDASAPTQESVFATLTKTGIPVGTPLYMAPEQIRGQTVDSRTDQFAWGVMAYELIAGKPPWEQGDSLQLVAAILTDEPTDLKQLVPDLRSDVTRIVHRALQKKPEDRYPNTEALVADLEEALAERGTDRPPPPPRGGSRRDPTSMPPVSGVDLRQFNAIELSEILERALLRQPAVENALDASDLLDLASRAGVEPSVLEQVAEDLSSVKSPHERQAEARRGFRSHLLIWAACGVFFFLMNMFSSGSNLWFQYPIISWGLGVAIHGINVHVGKGQPHKPRRRKTRKLLNQLRGQRSRTGLSLEPAVREVLRWTEAAARGMSTPPPPSPSEAHAQPSQPPQDYSSKLSWDARFAARRIDSRLGSAPSASEPPPAQMAEAEQLAEQEAAEAEREKRILKVER